jgi:hypothetical protein
VPPPPDQTETSLLQMLWRAYTMRGVRACIVACALTVLWGSRYTVQAVLTAVLWLAVVLAEHCDQHRARRTDETGHRHPRRLHRWWSDDDDPGLGRSR